MKLFNLKNLVKISVVAAISIAPTFAISALIPGSMFDEYETINNRTKELNLHVFEKIQIISDTYKFKMEDYVPYTRLSNDDDDEKVAQKILAKTVDTLLEDIEVASSSNGSRGLASINDALSTSVSTHDSAFEFKLRALQAEAQIVYNGPVKVTLKYDIADEETSIGFRWNF